MAKVTRSVMISAQIEVEIEDTIDLEIDDDANPDASQEDILMRRAEVAGHDWAERAGLDNFSINAL